MEKNQIPELSLSSGHKMPVIGLGTFTEVTDVLPPPLTSIFLDAIDAGYRHFDTAATYGSEEPLGRAVAAAVEEGLIENRDEVFITSKLWCNDADHDLVLPALKKTLKKLRLEYVDLYLIHFPVRLKQEAEGYEFSKEDILPLDIKGTWEGMEECCRLGLAKSIGVSNFGIKKLSQLLQHATIPPVVNQVEMNVAWQQGKLLEFCKNNGIYLNAWSPLGANGAHWGSLRVMESPILEEIAAAKGKTVAQVALRWIYEQGAGIIVKSFSKERMKQNLQIFEWELSQEDLEKIKQIPQLRGYSGEMFIYKDGPYKTFEEIWDDDA